MLDLLESLEAPITFDRPPTPEEIRDLEKRGTNLLGGEVQAYVEIKQIKDNDYVLTIHRR